MRLPQFEYLRPDSLKECLLMLEESNTDARVMSGGTGLLVNMKHGVIYPKRVVSIKSLSELSSITKDSEGNVQIGACVTLSNLSKHPLISQKFPVLHNAVRSVGSMHIRNMATLGGNICLETRCWYYNQSRQWRQAKGLCHRTGGSVCHAISGSKRCHAINSSDTVVVLMALDALVYVMKKDQERSIPIREFFKDNGAHNTVLEEGEIVASIVIPKTAEFTPAKYIKIQHRQGIDFAIASIGAALKRNGKAGEMTIVVNSIASAPVMLKKTSQIIMESGFKEDAILKAAKEARSEIGTLTNLFSSAGYKRQIVEVLVRRVLYGIKDEMDLRRDKA